MNDKPKPGDMTPPIETITIEEWGRHTGASLVEHFSARMTPVLATLPALPGEGEFMADEDYANAGRILKALAQVDKDAEEFFRPSVRAADQLHKVLLDSMKTALVPKQEYKAGFNAAFDAKKQEIERLKKIAAEQAEAALKERMLETGKVLDTCKVDVEETETALASGGFLEPGTSFHPRYHGDDPLRSLQIWLDAHPDTPALPEVLRIHQVKVDRARLEAKAKAEGDKKLAEQIAAMPAPVARLMPAVAPAKPAPAPYVPPVAEGVVYRKTYSAEVVDLPKLIKAVSKGKAFVCCLQGNETYLNEKAREAKAKDAEIFPGVFCRESETKSGGK